jgi:hypothetical protein
MLDGPCDDARAGRSNMFEENGVEDGLRFGEAFLSVDLSPLASAQFSSSEADWSASAPLIRQKALP